MNLTMVIIATVFCFVKHLFYNLYFLFVLFFIFTLFSIIFKFYLLFLFVKLFNSILRSPASPMLSEVRKRNGFDASAAKH